MCCRLLVEPLDRALAVAVLETGLFSFASSHDGGTWKRKVIEDDGRIANVIAQVDAANGCLSLALLPSVSTFQGHAYRRISAGVYFEIASKYAEKVMGRIIQSGNVDQCIENRARERLLAQYPDLPLQWAQVCLGFRVVILGEDHGDLS